jgi:hypothetical protein
VKQEQITGAGEPVKSEVRKVDHRGVSNREKEQGLRRKCGAKNGTFFLPRAFSRTALSSPCLCASVVNLHSFYYSPAPRLLFILTLPEIDGGTRAMAK